MSNENTTKTINKEHSMQYPTILEYVKAIQDAGNNLDKLAHLTPVLDDHGEPSGRTMILSDFKSP